MISVETRYFNFNRIILLALGFWPYHRSKLVELQLILLFSILISFIFFQFTAFLTLGVSLKCIINILSSILCFIIFIIIYISFWIKIQTIKCLLEQIQQICDELKDKDEITIIEKYRSNAKRFTVRLSLFSFCFLSFLFIEPLWQRIFGIFLFKNESRLRHTMHIETEYFVNREKYFYLIWLHMNAALCIGMLVSLGIGALLFGYVTCACGFFRIACYRIEQALTNNMLKSISLEKDILIYEKMIYAVDIHRKAVKFTEFLTSSFDVFMFLFTIIIVICMSINLYGVILFKEDSTKLPSLIVRVFAILAFMAVANYAGQEIIDHSNHVFFTAYSVRWYKAPLLIQRLILFLLLSGNKTCTLNVCRLFVLSLDGFATLASASISYFTFLYSMQH